MKNNLLKIIKDYCNNKLTLFDFETKIINFPLNDSTDDFVNEISEDIAYTKKGNLTAQDLQNNLMSEHDLKAKLQKFISEE